MGLPLVLSSHLANIAYTGCNRITFLANLPSKDLDFGCFVLKSQYMLLELLKDET